MRKLSVVSPSLFFYVIKIPHIKRSFPEIDKQFPLISWSFCSIASPSESSFFVPSGLWSIKTYFQEGKVFQSEMKVKVADTGYRHRKQMFSK